MTRDEPISRREPWIRPVAMTDNGATGGDMLEPFGGTIEPADDVRWAGLRDRLARAAEDRRLLDVAYAQVESPLGDLVVAATPTGVVRLGFTAEGVEPVLAELAARVSPRVLEAPARLDVARRELDEYFAGRRSGFDLALDWTLTTGFRRAV